MRIVALSDTHTRHDNVQVPDGDVLVFAGDFASRGDELYLFRTWWNALPHRHKILVAGNHDRMLEVFPAYVEEFEQTHYLRETGIEIDGIYFWGSPGTLSFEDDGTERTIMRPKRWGFQLLPEDAKHRAAMIPDHTDVLITHGPPAGILDGFPIVLVGKEGLLRLGDPYLREVVETVRPAVHIFGHVHDGYGVAEAGDVAFHNVAICDGKYEPVNKPHVIDL